RTGPVSYDDEVEEVDVAPEPPEEFDFEAAARRLAHFNAIGTLTGKKTRDGVPLVQRPDGRLKRFFTVANMREHKRVGKRSADLPPLDLLHDAPLSLPDEMEINNNVVLIENTLLE